MRNIDQIKVRYFSFRRKSFFKYYLIYTAVKSTERDKVIKYVQIEKFHQHRYIYVIFLFTFFMFELNTQKCLLQVNQ